jgi:hypothetical protein
VNQPHCTDEKYTPGTYEVLQNFAAETEEPASVSESNECPEDAKR